MLNYVKTFIDFIQLHSYNKSFVPFISIYRRFASMKETKMTPVHAANLMRNDKNNALGVESILCVVF